MVRTGVTFADACAEYLRYVEFDLDRKPSTVVDYRSIIRAHLAAGIRLAAPRGSDAIASSLEATLGVCNGSKSKILTVVNGVLKRARRVHKLRYNPMADVEKPRFRATTTIEVSPGGGLGARPRGRVRAGRRDLPHRRLHRPAPRRADRAALARRRLHRRACASAASFAGGRLTSPKSGHVRSIPMAPDVASAMQVISDLRGTRPDRRWGPKKDPARRLAAAPCGPHRSAISLKSLNHASPQPTRLNLAVMYRARWKTSSGIPMWGW